MSQKVKHFVGNCPTSISAAQCRGARGLASMTQSMLAERAGVTRGVIIDFENGTRNPQSASLEAIRRVLEKAGVIFIDENGNGPGVRLKNKMLKR
jgi:predicted transcriptional regulator